MPMKRFESKAVVVSGGADGVGRAAALRCAEEGYLIVAGIEGLVAEAARHMQSNERFDLEAGHEPRAAGIGWITTAHEFDLEFRALTSEAVILDIHTPFIGSNIRLDYSI